MIYHYTTIANAIKIFETGYLKVSEFERKRKIKPASLWLSKNKQWEPTATKLIYDSVIKEIRELTFNEQHEIAGCVRFTLTFDKKDLCNWAKYKNVSNTSILDYYIMENVGQENGAKPSDWYASFKDISIRKIKSFEIWDGNEWVLVKENYVGVLMSIQNKIENYES